MIQRDKEKVTRKSAANCFIDRTRLKRESFIGQSRILERRQEDILDHNPKEIPPTSCRSCLE